MRFESCLYSAIAEVAGDCFVLSRGAGGCQIVRHHGRRQCVGTVSILLVSGIFRARDDLDHRRIVWSSRAGVLAPMTFNRTRRCPRTVQSRRRRHDIVPVRPLTHSKSVASEISVLCSGSEWSCDILQKVAIGNGLMLSRPSQQAACVCAHFGTPAMHDHVARSKSDLALRPATRSAQRLRDHSTLSCGPSAELRMLCPCAPDPSFETVKSMLGYAMLGRVFEHRVYVGQLQAMPAYACMRHTSRFRGLLVNGATLFHCWSADQIVHIASDASGSLGNCPWQLQSTSGFRAREDLCARPWPRAS